MTTARSAPALWAPFVEGLPVDGGSICVVAATGAGSTVGSSDDIASRLDALQAELGEGPHWEALRTGEPVLVPDLRSSDANAAWPVLGLALGETPARAMFAFPMMLGLVTVGVADLYSRTVGTRWSAELIASGSAIAAAAALPAVRIAARSASAERPSTPEGTAEMRREVHQATGMVIVQLDVDATEALGRLEAHAFRTGRPLMDVARDVVARRLDFRTGSE